MAVLTSGGISSVAIALLTRQLVLPQTVTAIPGDEFAGSNGDTITVRVPQPSASRTQDNPGDTLVADEVDEVPVTVQVNHLYHLKNVSDQQLSLEIEDFARQITRPQTEAVAVGAEDQVASVMNGATASLSIADDGSNVEEVILEARERLGRANVPATDRWFAVSPEVATFVMGVDKFVRVDASGNDAALRESVIGRLYGFTFVESAGLNSGRAMAYHRSGFAWANRVPVTPRGATDSSVANAHGVGIRHVFQYNANTAQDQSLISTFAGAAAVYEDQPSQSDNRRWIAIDTEGS